LIRESLKLGFLASGNGTSARAIVGAIKAGQLQAEPRLLVANSRKASAMDFAREAGLASLCIPTQADPQGADEALAAEMAAHGVELIVLSGYLRSIGPATLARYAGRILNIHPGPLPTFGGRGMYGRRVHEAVIAAGEHASEICILVVEEEYDRGPVIARRAVPVRPNDDAAALESRVAAAEPDFFVETLQRIISGELHLPISDNIH
jgi:phosphoribosylglycinamide formyltransferase-1